MSSEQLERRYASSWTPRTASSPWTRGEAGPRPDRGEPSKLSTVEKTYQDILLSSQVCCQDLARKRARERMRGVPAGAGAHHDSWPQQRALDCHRALLLPHSQLSK